MKKLSLFLLLLVAFLDYLGLGLVFPLFASLFFDPAIAPFSIETSDTIRAMWMGVLIAVSPLSQLLFSPILGSLSDQKGRKPVLMAGLAVGMVGYLFGVLGIQWHSLSLLVLYRFLLGASMATATVVQAALVDISTKETKSRYFSLYNMALGTGFTVGPYLGGKLSDSTVVSWFNFATPFLFCMGVVLVNLALIFWRFSETRKQIQSVSVDFFRGLKEAKKGLMHPTLRYVFLGFFFFAFGWDYFVEFVSVTFKMVYNFSPSQIGDCLGYMGFFYALFVATFVPFIAKRFELKRVLVFSMFASGGYLLLFSQIRNPSLLWVFLPGLQCLIALFYPVASTYISDNASSESQGEVLGIYHSVQAVAFIVSPLISGSLVGAVPLMPVYLGGASMILGGSVFAANLFWLKRVDAQRLN